LFEGSSWTPLTSARPRRYVTGPDDQRGLGWVVSTRLPIPHRHKGLIEVAILRPPEVTRDMAVVACGASCCDRSGREVKGTRRESGELRQATRMLRRKHANRLGDVTFTAQFAPRTIDGAGHVIYLEYPFSFEVDRIVQVTHFISLFISLLISHNIHKRRSIKPISVGVPCFELNNGALSTNLAIAVCRKGSLSSENSNCDLVIVRAWQQGEIIAIFVSLCCRY
jgi:hypothetical protein